MRAQLRKTAILVAIGAAIVALSLLAAISRPRDARRSAAVASAGDLPRGTAALRLTVDPETGRIAAGKGGLGVGFERSAAGLREERLPDGLVKVDLQGRFRSALVVHVDPQTGKVSKECVETADNDASRRAEAHR